jgi:hypothetical protein
MCHRIRELLRCGPTSPIAATVLFGIVEAGETYWGSTRDLRAGERGYGQKMKRVSLVERHNEKRTFYVANITAESQRRQFPGHRVSSQRRRCVCHACGFNLVLRAVPKRTLQAESLETHEDYAMSHHFLFVVQAPSPGLSSAEPDAPARWLRFETKANAIAPSPAHLKRLARNCWLFPAEHSGTMLVQLTGLCEQFEFAHTALMLSGEVTTIAAPSDSAKAGSTTDNGATEPEHA